MSIRDDILAFDDHKHICIPVPEWRGITVYARTMDATRQLRYIELAKRHPDTAGSVVLIVFSAEDEQGNPIFTEADIPALEKKNAAGLNRVFTLINDLTPSLEEIRKNLPPPQRPSSP